MKLKKKNNHIQCTGQLTDPHQSPVYSESMIYINVVSFLPFCQTQMISFYLSIYHLLFSIIFSLSHSFLHTTFIITRALFFLLILNFLHLARTRAHTTSVHTSYFRVRRAFLAFIRVSFTLHHGAALLSTAFTIVIRYIGLQLS